MAQAAFLQPVLQDAVSGNVGGLLLRFFLVASVVNVPFVDADLTMQPCTITAKFVGPDGVTYDVIPGMPLTDLVAACGYEFGDFQAIRTWTAVSTILIAAGAAQKEFRMLTLKLRFPAVLNIGSGGGKLSVVARTTGMNANNVFDTSSTVTLETYEGIGVTPGIPFWYRDVAQVSATNFLSSVPAGATEAYLLNHNKSTVTTATEVVSTIGLRGDVLSGEYVYEQLLGMRNFYFQSAADAQLRFQNWKLYGERGTEPSPLATNMAVNVSLVGTQVAADVNTLVAGGICLTEQRAYWAANTQVKHEARTLGRLVPNFYNHVVGPRVTAPKGPVKQFNRT